MNLLKAYSFFFIMATFVSPNGIALAEAENNAVSRPIYIGVPGNRHPYSYANENNKIEGLLIDRIIDICSKSGLSCNFIKAGFHDSLADLNLINIDAILVIDSIIIPKSDEVKITLPLCKYNPIFVKKVRLSLQKQVVNDDLKGKTLGVMAESAFHLYALDNYYSFTDIKPYETLESAVFDLFSGKIDLLFTEEAFYATRIGSTLLGNRHNGFWLKPLASDSVSLPDTMMTLAIRNNDDELWNKMASAMTKQDAERPCSALLPDPDAKIDNEKPANDTNSFEKN